MEHLKVAYLLGGLNRGGTETLVLDVLKQKLPFEAIAIHRSGGDLKDEYYATNKQVFCLPYKKKHIITYLIRLRRLLIEQEIMVVHAQQFADCVFAKIATIGTNIKVIETIHSYISDEDKYLRAIVKFSMALADKVIFVSNSQRQWFIDNYKMKHLSKKSVVVYNGIDLSKFERKYAVPDFLIDKDRQVVRLAMVANFTGTRCQKMLSECVADLVAKGRKDFHLYFVGRKTHSEPQVYDDCNNYCRTKGLDRYITFVGGRDDVPAILQHIDGFVFATQWDSFGIGIVEALVSKVPVMASDIEAIREVTNDGEWAMLFDAQNHEQCTHYLELFIDRLSELKKQMDEISKQVRQKYSIERHVEYLKEQYDE